MSLKTPVVPATERGHQTPVTDKPKQNRAATKNCSLFFTCDGRVNLYSFKELYTVVNDYVGSCLTYQHIPNLFADD